MNLEWVLFCLAVGWAFWWLIQAPVRKNYAKGLALGVLVLAAASAAGWEWKRRERSESDLTLARSVPRADRRDGYVSSDQCQACHAEEYQSWHASFHRTMTQLAGERTVVGDFNNVELELGGRRYLLQKRANEFWVELEPDGEWAGVQVDAGNGRVRRRITLLTGSHHMQVYWMQADGGNRQGLFPFAWLIGDRRWVPFNDTFLRDPAAPPAEQTWNLNCINCHSTGGQPRPDVRTGLLDTRAGELGIACEACHGMGAEHVRMCRDPLKRYLAHRKEKEELKVGIVNPERLTAKQSSEVCGNCHGIKWIPNRNDWLMNGYRYQPGQELNHWTPIVRPSRLEEQPWLTAPLKNNPTFLTDRYWADGMVRVSGREYNGLVDSACHLKGNLSCISCHSMHSPVDRDDQLAPLMNSNQACLSCHGTIDPARHSHHAAGSGGSQCYNCHMPHTTYGLLKAIRSHQIDSPRAEVSLRTGRPNACNLCHLDKSLGWTAEHLTAWYGHKPLAMNPDEAQVSAMVLLALKGDAGQRALAAWSMGWEEAHKASGRDWLAPFLGRLLEDPYSAVRYIAHRSLKQISKEYERVPYDFVGAAGQRKTARETIMSLWRQQKSVDRSGPDILVERAGRLRDERIEDLARQRDDRSMDLQE